MYTDYQRYDLVRLNLVKVVTSFKIIRRYISKNVLTPKIVCSSRSVLRSDTLDTKKDGHPGSSQTYSLPLTSWVSRGRWIVKGIMRCIQRGMTMDVAYKDYKTITNRLESPTLIFFFLFHFVQNRSFPCVRREVIFFLLSSSSNMTTSPKSLSWNKGSRRTYFWIENGVVVFVTFLARLITW